jgi:hypothetical protein
VQSHGDGLWSWWHSCNSATLFVRWGLKRTRLASSLTNSWARASASEYDLNLLSLLHMRVKFVGNREVTSTLLGFFVERSHGTLRTSAETWQGAARVHCCDLSERAKGHFGDGEAGR